MVAATMRTIFAQATPAETTAQLHEVVSILERQFPKAAETLAAAEVDVTRGRLDHGRVRDDIRQDA